MVIHEGYHVSCLALLERWLGPIGTSISPEPTEESASHGGVKGSRGYAGSRAQPPDYARTSDGLSHSQPFHGFAVSSVFATKHTSLPTSPLSRKDREGVSLLPPSQEETITCRTYHQRSIISVCCLLFRIRQPLTCIYLSDDLIYTHVRNLEF